MSLLKTIRKWFVHDNISLHGLLQKAMAIANERIDKAIPDTKGWYER